MERPRRGDRAGLNEVDGLLTKAERVFAACEILLREGHADSAASRVYYGYFYVAEALLLSEGLRFSSHGQVVGQYGQRFAKTDALERRYGRLLARAFALRQSSPTTGRPPTTWSRVRSRSSSWRAAPSSRRGAGTSRAGGTGRMPRDPDPPAHVDGRMRPTDAGAPLLRARPAVSPRRRSRYNCAH